VHRDAARLTAHYLRTREVLPPANDFFGAVALKV
ncbi:MAG: hypothetical protein QOI11_1491, partial [Candidatus Eremiobacteraeota bacterium]|jgi:hypothetical protein|nr:hypothetical protein [Candidatus Eremiobacteraeota bacterium]